MEDSYKTMQISTTRDLISQIEEGLTFCFRTEKEPLRCFNLTIFIELDCQAYLYNAEF